MSRTTLLVIGGTGKTGGAVVRRVLSASGRPPVVRVMSRRNASLDGVELALGDVADADAVRRAMRGVTHVVYAVGPRGPGTSTRASYVTGLRNVLEAGRDDRLLQVVLLSARNCAKPWRPTTVLLNALAGGSQLHHQQQERMLREEAASRPEFSYVVVRPPRLGPAETTPEPVGVVAAGRGRYFGHTSVSRAAVAEAMVRLMSCHDEGDAAASDAPRRVSFELWSESARDTSATFDWDATLAALPDDDSSDSRRAEALPPASRDVDHRLAQLVYLLGPVGVIAAGIIALLRQ